MVWRQRTLTSYYINLVWCVLFCLARLLQSGSEPRPLSCRLGHEWARQLLLNKYTYMQLQSPEVTFHLTTGSLRASTLSSDLTLEFPLLCLKLTASKMVAVTYPLANALRECHDVQWRSDTHSQCCVSLSGIFAWSHTQLPCTVMCILMCSFLWSVFYEFFALLNRFLRVN